MIPFLIAAFVLAITPGPGIAYVVARTVSGGRKEELASCIGTGLSGLIHVMASALGVWGCTEFCVNGLMAGNRRTSRSGYDLKHKESSTQRSH